MENFDEYLRQGEPNKAEKAKVWKTAIGLQQEDGWKPPELLLKENFSLKNFEMHILADTVNDTVKPQIDTVNDTVFSLIKQDNKITAKEISERLKMSLSTVRRKVKELRDSAKIERIGSDKTGHWKIIEKKSIANWKENSLKKGCPPTTKLSLSRKLSEHWGAYGD